MARLEFEQCGGERVCRQLENTCPPPLYLNLLHLKRNNRNSVAGNCRRSVRAVYLVLCYGVRSTRTQKHHRNISKIEHQRYHNGRDKQCQPNAIICEMPSSHGSLVSLKIITPQIAPSTNAASAYRAPAFFQTNSSDNANIMNIQFIHCCTNGLVSALIACIISCMRWL